MEEFEKLMQLGSAETSPQSSDQINNKAPEMDTHVAEKPTVTVTENYEPEQPTEEAEPYEPEEPTPMDDVYTPEEPTLPVDEVKAAKAPSVTSSEAYEPDQPTEEEKMETDEGDTVQKGKTEVAEVEADMPQLVLDSGQSADKGDKNKLRKGDRTDQNDKVSDRETSSESISKSEQENLLPEVWLRKKEKKKKKHSSHGKHKKPLVEWRMGVLRKDYVRKDLTKFPVDEKLMATTKHKWNNESEIEHLKLNALGDADLTDASEVSGMISPADMTSDTDPDTEQDISTEVETDAFDQKDEIAQTSHSHDVQSKSISDSDTKPCSSKDSVNKDEKLEEENVQTDMKKDMNSDNMKGETLKESAQEKDKEASNACEVQEKNEDKDVSEKEEKSSRVSTRQSRRISGVGVDSEDKRESDSKDEKKEKDSSGRRRSRRHRDDSDDEKEKEKKEDDRSRRRSRRSERNKDESVEGKAAEETKIEPDSKADEKEDNGKKSQGSDKQRDSSDNEKKEDKADKSEEDSGRRRSRRSTRHREESDGDRKEEKRESESKVSKREDNSDRRRSRRSNRHREDCDDERDRRRRSDSRDRRRSNSRERRTNSRERKRSDSRERIRSSSRERRRSSSRERRSDSRESRRYRDDDRYDRYGRDYRRSDRSRERSEDRRYRDSDRRRDRTDSRERDDRRESRRGKSEDRKSKEEKAHDKDKSNSKALKDSEKKDIKEESSTTPKSTEPEEDKDKLQPGKDQNSKPNSSNKASSRLPVKFNITSRTVRRSTRNAVKAKVGVFGDDEEEDEDEDDKPLAELKDTKEKKEADESSTKSMDEPLTRVTRSKSRDGQTVTEAQEERHKSQLPPVLFSEVFPSGSDTSGTEAPCEMPLRKELKMDGQESESDSGAEFGLMTLSDEAPRLYPESILHSQLEMELLANAFCSTDTEAETDTDKGNDKMDENIPEVQTVDESDVNKEEISESAEDSVIEKDNADESDANKEEVSESAETHVTDKDNADESDANKEEVSESAETHVTEKDNADESDANKEEVSESAETHVTEKDKELVIVADESKLEIEGSSEHIDINQTEDLETAKDSNVTDVPMSISPATELGERQRNEAENVTTDIPTSINDSSSDMDVGEQIVSNEIIKEDVIVMESKSEVVEVTETEESSEDFKETFHQILDDKTEQDQIESFVAPIDPGETFDIKKDLEQNKSSDMKEDTASELESQDGALSDFEKRETKLNEYDTSKTESESDMSGMEIIDLMDGSSYRASSYSVLMPSQASDTDTDVQMVESTDAEACGDLSDAKVDGQKPGTLDEQKETVPPAPLLDGQKPGTFDEQKETVPPAPLLDDQIPGTLDEQKETVPPASLLDDQIPGTLDEQKETVPPASLLDDQIPGTLDEQKETVPPASLLDDQIPGTLDEQKETVPPAPLPDDQILGTLDEQKETVPPASLLDDQIPGTRDEQKETVPPAPLPDDQILGTLDEQKETVPPASLLDDQIPGTRDEQKETVSPAPVLDDEMPGTLDQQKETIPPAPLPETSNIEQDVPIDSKSDLPATSTMDHNEIETNEIETVQHVGVGSKRKRSRWGIATEENITVPTVTPASMWEMTGVENVNAVSHETKVFSVDYFADKSKNIPAELVTEVKAEKTEEAALAVDTKNAEPLNSIEEVKKEPSGNEMPKRKRKSRWDPVETSTEGHLIQPSEEVRIPFPTANLSEQSENLSAIFDNVKDSSAHPAVQEAIAVPSSLEVKSDLAAKDNLAAEIPDKSVESGLQGEEKDDVSGGLNVPEMHEIQDSQEPDPEEESSPAKRVKVEITPGEQEDRAERTILGYDVDKLGDAAMDASSQESYTSQSTADTTQSTDGDSSERELSPTAEMEVDGAGDHRPSMEGTCLETHYEEVSMMLKCQNP